MYAGACFMLLNGLIDCSQPRMDFRELYARQCYRALEGNWAGRSGEEFNTVVKRVMDGVALYQDYVVQYNESCKKGN